MSLDANHTDLVIQYALLLAGEEEDQFDRQLGPIHLVKYVFLADLAYAKRFEGSSFTGARWRFHNFGPWDAEVFNRIEPAANAIRAQVLKFDSNYGDDDWVRYRLRDSDKLRELEKQIPTPIKLLLPRHVHKFLGDTPSLLDFVYKTEPMIIAAPKEDLDFSIVAKPKLGRDERSQARFKRSTTVPPGQHESDTAQLKHERLSNKKKKRFHERVRELHVKQVVKPKLINPVKSPRYDDIYKQGVAWLEELAGSPELEPGELTAEFSNDVWKSASRKGQDVP
ncbi:MAG: Panacea domain-containing protein [Gammaproteobacteria bacterium]|nr:Panacea domain-containing protein [Gammaproteobacteria bacterium]MDH5304265.1 Panacea domain-containing protein [Gammaproteobacteria bacterium]MDH5321531.1 Panacea domain-containing protein [Gammaproteobacteria bacterium]